MVYEIDNDTIDDISLSNSLLLSEPNLILGIAQVGSLFNHTHEGITSTRLDVYDLDRYKKRLEQLRKFKYDTCIGMINPQYAGNLFECNDTKKSIGFQYLTDELENNVITYGQYTHNLNINGTNFDGKSIHQTPSGTAGNILVLDLGDSNSYPTGIVGEQFNNISAEPSAGYYNAGTFWHKYLNDKEVHYDLINVTSANTEEFIRNLCSRSTENLYLTQLLKYYFSTLYPTPHTVLIIFGFRAGSFNFSRMRRMCTITVLLLSRYASFHTVSNIFSEETTFPAFSQSNQRISNSVGVNTTGSSNKVTVCSCLLMLSPCPSNTSEGTCPMTEYL
jgi:hypothetical protein